MAKRSIGWSGGTFAGFTNDFKTAVSAGRGVGTLPAFSEVVEYYPTHGPFLGGSTVVSLFANAIPRTLWPDKPIAMSKIVAFHREGIHDPIRYSRTLDASIHFQSYSATFVGEMWANFGWAGVVLGSVLLTMIYRFLEALFSSSRVGILGPLFSGALVTAVLIQNRGDLITANKHTLSVLAISAAAIHGIRLVANCRGMRQRIAPAKHAHTLKTGLV